MLCKQIVDEVVWFNPPSYAELFFRECFFTKAQRIVWNYQNAYQENEVILGIVKMYHEVWDDWKTLIKKKNY